MQIESFGYYSRENAVTLKCLLAVTTGVSYKFKAGHIINIPPPLNPQITREDANRSVITCHGALQVKTRLL